MNPIEQAFQEVPRQNFLPDEVQPSAGLDRALPIGFGQTNSQPSTVAQMLQWLDPKPGDKILDVGSGSGWTAALLGYLTGTEGEVYAVEKIPELVRFGRRNCRRLDITNVKFFEVSQALGLPRYAPYDRILVSATSPDVPHALVGQLKPDGKLVIPVRHDILEITKSATGVPDVITHPGFVFVPLI